MADGRFRWFIWFLSFLLFVWLTRETRKTKETKLTKTYRFGHLSIGIWDYVENNPNYPPSPLVSSGPEEPLARRGEGGGEGEYAMSTSTSILPPAFAEAATRRQASRGRIRLGNFHVLWEAMRP